MLNKVVLSAALYFLINNNDKQFIRISLKFWNTNQTNSFCLLKIKISLERDESIAVISKRLCPN